jgi:hypothetical protein
MVNIQRLWLIVISSFIAGAGRFALRKEKGQPQLTLSPFALNDRPAVKSAPKRLERFSRYANTRQAEGYMELRG